MSGIWPGETQCVAMLGFDVDGVSSWLNRDPNFINHPSLMSMAEYGPAVATPRILDMLDAHNVPASFYVPGYVAENYPDLVKEIAARGHEVAHHGYMHEPPSTLTREQEDDVLKRGIDILGGITGERPVGYRSPSWELSEHSLTCWPATGFLYDSSLMGDDAPYIETAPQSGKKLVEIPIHWLLDDAPNFVYAPVANRLGPHAQPRRGLPDLGRRVRGTLTLWPRLRADHAPPVHRPPRPPADAGTPHRAHQDLPQRPVHARAGRRPPLRPGGVMARTSLFTKYAKV